MGLILPTNGENIFTVTVWMRKFLLQRAKSA